MGTGRPKKSIPIEQFEKLCFMQATEAEICDFFGVTKKVDLQPLLKYPAFAELKDKKKFVQFGLDQTIFWYNGADIAPEYLYDNGVIA